MKRALLLMVALLMISGAAYSCPGLGTIGLFADPDHSVWCVTGAGFYPVEMWVWCLPGPLGQMCAEFSICYPVNVIQSTVTWNDPIISVSLGDFPSGLSVCFIVCQWNWFWIGHQLLYVTDSTMTHVRVCPHPDIGIYQFANCEPGYPTEPVCVLTNLYLNYGTGEEECMFVGTEQSSWGAIKGMYSE